MWGTESLGVLSFVGAGEAGFGVLSVSGCEDVHAFTV